MSDEKIKKKSISLKKIEKKNQGKSGLTQLTRHLLYKIRINSKKNETNNKV
jgi:hypothetical protein